MPLTRRSRCVFFIALFTLISVECACQSRADLALPRRVDSGFDMQTNAFAFRNFADGFSQSKMTPELMARMFGEQAVCAEQVSPCKLKPAADAWMKKANAAMAGGRCEGFAMTSQLMFLGLIDPLAFGSADARTLELRNNPALQRELAYWFATQMTESVSKATQGFAAKDVMPFLAKVLAPDATERFRIGIVRKTSKGLSGGHAITPIGYSAGEKDGEYVVRVYDNNHPNEEREMHIDVLKNRWEYAASSNPTKAEALYFGDAQNKNLLYFAPDAGRLRTLPCPFCSEAESTQVIASGDLSVGVEDSEGNFNGVAGGEVSMSNGGSVVPMLSAENFEDDAPTLIHVGGSGNLRVKITGASSMDAPAPARQVVGVDSGVLISGPSFSVSVSALAIPEDASDEVVLSDNGGTVQYNNSSGTPVQLETSVETNGVTSSVVVAAPEGSATITTRIDRQDGSISVNATGAEENGLVVAVRVVDTMTGEEKNGQIVVPPGSSTASVDIQTSNWESGEALQAEVDTGQGPVMVVDACLDNAKNGTETDVDCGGLCAAKCDVGRACAVGTDCSSAYCSANGACVTSHCEDGVQNESESGPDCGGDACDARCSAGVRCLNASDCASGLTCSSQICVKAYRVGGTLSGLPQGDRVVLQNNLGDDLQLTSNGPFQFSQRVLSSYVVSVVQQPATANCGLSAQAGNASSDVSNVSVVCTPTFAVAGTVTGLPVGDGLTLQNGTELLAVNADSSFVFMQRTPGAYAVSIANPPATASCVLANESGVATGNVSNVAVSCTPNFSLGGEVIGLGVGQSVTIANGSDTLTLSSDETFTFSQRVIGSYNVAIQTPPATGRCVLSNASGSAAANVTNVIVFCGYNLGGSAQGLSVGRSATLRAQDGQSLVVSANGSFTFPQPVSAGRYLVRVEAQPHGMVCAVRNAAGVASGDVSNVLLRCAPMVLPVQIGLAARYSALDDASIVRDGSNNVTEWQDVSGQGRHLTPASAQAPLYAPSLINGRAGLDFSSTIGMERRLESGPFGLSGDVTVFMVIQHRTPASSGTLAHHGDEQNDWSLEAGSADANTLLLQSAADTGTTQSVAAATNYVLGARVLGTTRSLLVTGSSTQESAAATATITPGSHALYVGSSTSFKGSNAYISELIYYGRALDDDERTLVMTYLRRAYGFPVPAPDALWLDAADSTTLTTDMAGYVSQWRDKSGQGRHAGSAGAVAPQWLANQTNNGMPALSFNGANVALSTASVLPSAQLSAFVTYRSTMPQSPATLLAQGTSWSLAEQGTDLAFSVGGEPSVAQIARNLGKWQTLSVVAPSGTTVLQSTTNASSSVAQTAITGGASAFRLGNDGAGTATIGGEIAEVRLFSSALHAVDRAYVEDDMRVKFSVPKSAEIALAESSSSVDEFPSDMLARFVARASSLYLFPDDWILWDMQLGVPATSTFGSVCFNNADWVARLYLRHWQRTADDPYCAGDGVDPDGLATMYTTADATQGYASYWRAPAFSPPHDGATWKTVQADGGGCPGTSRRFYFGGTNYGRGALFPNYCHGAGASLCLGARIDRTVNGAPPYFEAQAWELYDNGYVPATLVFRIGSGTDSKENVCGGTF